MSAERASRASETATPSRRSCVRPRSSSSAKRSITRAGSNGLDWMSTASYIWRRSAEAAPSADHSEHSPPSGTTTPWAPSSRAYTPACTGPAPRARGTGLGAGRDRPDADGTAHVVDPDDGPAAAPDRADVDAWDEVFVLVDDALVARHRVAVPDEADVERRAAHVGGDDVLVADDRAEVLRGQHTGHGGGVYREERAARRLRGRDHTAATLHDLERKAQAARLRSRFEPAEIARHHRAEVGVEHRRHRALVLAPARDQVGRAADEHLRRELLDHRLHPPLVLGVLERPQEADGDRLDALRDELLDRLARDRKSTRLNSSHGYISYAVFCLKKKSTSIQYVRSAQQS